MPSYQELKQPWELEAVEGFGPELQLVRKPASEPTDRQSAPVAFADGYLPSLCRLPLTSVESVGAADELPTGNEA